jgi:hypothetical protein
MSDTARSIRWRSDDGTTIEQCVVKLGGTTIVAEGIVIGGTDDAEYGLRYRIVVDAEWAGLRSIHVTRLGGATVALRHDGYGEWTDGEGKKRPDLSKCLDLVIDGALFPISVTAKRLAWKANKVLDLPAIHIALPTLEVSAVLLKVSAIEPGKRYRVVREGTDSVDIALDADGLVTQTATLEDADAVK